MNARSASLGCKQRCCHVCRYVDWPRLWHPCSPSILGGSVPLEYLDYPWTAVPKRNVCSPTVFYPVARFGLSALPFAPTQAPVDSPAKPRLAVATLACDDSDVVALHMFLYSLVGIDHQVPFDIVVLLSERVSSSQAQRLEESLGEQSPSRLVRFVRQRPVAHTCVVERLYLFGMVEYARVLFVPVHSLVLQPLSSWLSAPKDRSRSAAAPPLSHVLLGDVLSIEPSERGFETMLQQARACAHQARTKRAHASGRHGPLRTPTRIECALIAHGLVH